MVILCFSVLKLKGLSLLLIEPWGCPPDACTALWGWVTDASADKSFSERKLARLFTIWTILSLP